VAVSAPSKICEIFCRPLQTAAELGILYLFDKKCKEVHPNMAQITKDTIIGDILDIAPDTAPIFLSIGMHCLGCPSSRGETVEEACMVHGVDVDALLDKLNSTIA
jgi:hybrid cluster-associated redox disulfide protein